ncbi:MAG: TonB family protein, partial [Nitrospirota bacterium]
AAEDYPEETGERVTDLSAQPVEFSQLPEIIQTVSSSDKKYPQVPVLEKGIKRTEGFKNATAMSVANPAVSVLPSPDVESQVDSKLFQIETELENPVVLQRPQRVIRTLFSKAVLPDYAWLMDTLRTKLESVKTYPSLAKANHWQGRVVVQIRVDGDGRIANPEIEESSGYPVLDQAALDALQAASPLTLSYRLDGPPIVMLIPLNYQLE